MAHRAEQRGSGRSIVISAISADFDRKLESIRSVRDEISPYFELELSGTKVETRVCALISTQHQSSF